MIYKFWIIVAHQFWRRIFFGTNLFILTNNNNGQSYIFLQLEMQSQKMLYLLKDHFLTNLFYICFTVISRLFVQFNLKKAMHEVNPILYMNKKKLK